MTLSRVMNGLRSSHPRNGGTKCAGDASSTLLTSNVLLRQCCKNRAGASGKIDAACLASFGGDGAHKFAQSRLRYGLTHSAARSKLTSLRISALYRE
jgi:hypothetical protein